MRVFMTGATGLIGGGLVSQLLQRGDTPVVLTRDVARARKRLSNPKTEIVAGDPQHEGDWMAAVDGCEAIVNMAGQPVFAKRWNEAEKTLVRNSRILSTNNLIRAIERAKSRPRALVSTSAIGFYGDVPEGDLDEGSAAGNDFMAKLCVDWEAAAREAEKHGVRVAIVRVGVVLDRNEGALKQMLLPFKLGLGGPIGLGKRWMSWIHIDDIVGVFLKALDDPEARGPINGTAPEPVRNGEFSKALAGALHRPCLFPVPPLALKVMFGEVSQVVLGSQKVLPKQAQKLGYAFKYANVQGAMKALFA